MALSVPEAKLLPPLAPTFVHGSRGLLAFSVRCAVGSSVTTVVSEARLQAAPGSVASQSFRYVCYWCVQPRGGGGKGLVELTDVSIMRSDELDKRETSLPPEYRV